MTVDSVTKDIVVSFKYVLHLDDGELVEQTEPDEDLVYLHGHDNIIPGLERELVGLRVGDTRKVVVEPEDAYGEYDPDDVDEMDQADFPPEIEPVTGMVLTVETSEGEGMLATIVDIEDGVVVLDFNHPMAGQRLHFDITITGLRAATEEELAHGHAH